MLKPFNELLYQVLSNDATARSIAISPGLVAIVSQC